MAIVKMNKFSLITFEYHKFPLLKELQKFGNVHFKNLQKEDLKDLEFLKKDNSSVKISEYESEIAKIKFSLEKIAPYAVKTKGLKALTEPMAEMPYEEFDNFANSFNYTSVYDSLKRQDESLKIINSQRNEIKNQNDNLNNWIKLDISVEQLEKLKSVKYFIGLIGKNAANSLRESFESKFSNSYVEYFGAIKEDVTALIVVLNEDYQEASEMLKNVGFSRTTLNFGGVPANLVKENNSKLEALSKKEDEEISVIKSFAGERGNLEVALDYFNTALERAKACENFLKMERVVLIDGWVPADKSQKLNSIITGICMNDFYLEETAVEKDNAEVPITLKNNKLVSAFEDVTAMYSMPKYGEIDPTPLLAPFYMVFFGLMVGDFGYGLLLMIGTSLALKFFNLKQGMRNFLKFFFWLSISTMIAGVIYGSFFGVTFFAPIQTPDGPKAILDSGKDIVTMIILSVIVGVVQVIFGICVKGYMLIRDGHPWAALFDAGFWIAAVLSGIGLIVSVALAIPEPFFTVCWWTFWLSLLGLAATQGRESASIGGKIGTGLYSVYGITSYVGDLISYTRIIALALSGAYIAFSFNLMVGLIPGGIGIIFKVIISVFGHALNIGLALLGAYVHTCRLQYVEYFSKFYEGGGVVFKPLKLKNDHILIKD